VQILRVVLNDGLLNGIGVLEDLISTQEACSGVSYQHSAYDACSAARPRPLSLGAARVSLLRLHELWRAVVRRTVHVAFLTLAPEKENMDRFFLALGLTLFGPDAGNAALLLQRVLANLAPAARNLALALPQLGGNLVAVGTLYALFLYETYALPFLGFCLQEFASRKFTTQRAWDFGVRTHYDATMGGAVDDNILRSLDRTCFLLAELAWDATNPLGRSLLLGCRAGVEGIRVALRASAELLVVHTLHQCICRSPDVDYCAQMMPVEFTRSFRIVTEEPSMQREECLAVVEGVSVKMFNLPVRLTRLLSRWGDALADATAYLPSLTGIPGFDYTECSNPARNLDSVVLLPQPVVAFAACGLTPTCRTKCGLEIAAFEQEKRVPQRFESTGQAHALRTLGPWEGDEFEALQAQYYTTPALWKKNSTDCLYHLVVVTRGFKELRRDDWKLRFFCVDTTLVGELWNEREPVSIPGTARWRLPGEAGEGLEVEKIALAPQIFGGENSARMAMAVLVVQTYDAAQLRSRVHRFRVGAKDGAVLEEDILLDTENFAVRYLSTMQVEDMMAEECYFLEEGSTIDDVEIVEPAAGVSGQDHTRLRAVGVVHAGDASSASFYVLATTAVQLRQIDTGTTCEWDVHAQVI